MDETRVRVLTLLTLKLEVPRISRNFALRQVSRERIIHSKKHSILDDYLTLKRVLYPNTCSGN